MLMDYAFMEIKSQFLFLLGTAVRVKVTNGVNGLRITNPGCIFDCIRCLALSDRSCRLFIDSIQFRQVIQTTALRHETFTYLDLKQILSNRDEFLVIPKLHDGSITNFVLTYRSFQWE